jgi:hypothetical protein
MPRDIWTFKTGTRLQFDHGQFDQWCVYEVAVGGSKRAPRDEEYFTELSDLASAYGHDRIYADFVTVFDASGPEVTKETVSLVVEISRTYPIDEERILRTLLILHMAMVAENLKANTRLGKRIKRLGVYELLFENRTARDASNFMRGMGWREISAMCEERGF